MFIVVSEFSFVRSLNSPLYHEHYIGNSEWVNRERFRTRLQCEQLCMCGRSMFHTCGPLLNMSVWKLVRYASAPNRAPRTETIQYKYMYRYTPSAEVQKLRLRATPMFTTWNCKQWNCRCMRKAFDQSQQTRLLGRGALKGNSGVKWIWDMFCMITSWNVHFGAQKTHRRCLQLAVFSWFYQNAINLERRGQWLW